nr:putative pathogenesis-related protein [Quercus suber]
MRTTRTCKPPNLPTRPANSGNSAAGGGGYGQNIAAGVKADNISRVITDLFYNGEVGYYDDLYGEATPTFTNFVHWGHFSQVVWKQTSTVGCAVQYCPGGLANTGSNIPPYFTVCNYGPPGMRMCLAYPGKSYDSNTLQGTISANLEITLVIPLVSLPPIGVQDWMLRSKPVMFLGR